MSKDGRKIIAQNKKARHDYFIEETFEAGIVLVGTEVKSIRQGKVSIRESYCAIENGEVFVYGMHVTPYEHGSYFNLDPVRKRKLLLHKRQIKKLIGQTQVKGYTLIPLSIYLVRGLVKVELALAKGKKLYDKRETLAKKDAQRRIDRALADRY